jgi:hypothetical protein
MAEWKNEDDIKAELRVLTKELKQLREELHDMVTPPKQNPSRAFLHRQSWPQAKSRSTEIATAADRTRAGGKRRGDKDR